MLGSHSEFVCVNLCPPAMVELDGDDIRISSRGKLAERDIVQVTALYNTKETLHCADLDSVFFGRQCF